MNKIQKMEEKRNLCQAKHWALNLSVEFRLFSTLNTDCRTKCTIVGTIVDLTIMVDVMGHPVCYGHSQDHARQELDALSALHHQHDQ